MHLIKKTITISSVYVFMFTILQFESNFFLFDGLAKFSFQTVLLYWFPC